MSLDPPSDTSIVTLWLGNVEDNITEHDIRDRVYAYGMIISLYVSRPGKCAFIEYANREMAEYAAKQLYRNLIIHGQQISVNWAKPRATMQGVVNSQGSAVGSELVMMAPPGMENAPMSAYSVTGATTKIQPVTLPPPPPNSPPPMPIIPSNGIVVPDDKNIHGKRPNTAHNTHAKFPRPPVYPSTNPTRLGSN